MPGRADWVLKMRQEGHSNKMIRESLIKKGYTKEQADAVMGAPRKKNPIWIWLTVLGGVLVLAVAAYFILQLLFSVERVETGKTFTHTISDPDSGETLLTITLGEGGGSFEQERLLMFLPATKYDKHLGGIMGAS